MKHLISLAMKYTTRQRFRSTLTFLCITLAVFIMNLFSACVSSYFATTRQNEINNFGSWHADFSGLLSNQIETEKPITEYRDFFANHAAVEDYYLSYHNSLTSSMIGDENNRITLFEIRLDNGEAVRVRDISSYKADGNNELPEPYNVILSSKTEKSENPNDIIAPGWLKDYGYSAGDTLTFSIMPVSAVLDESCEPVRKTIEAIEKKQAEKNDKYGVDNNDSEKPEIIKTYDFVFKLTQDYSLNEVALSDKKDGTESRSFTCNIIGFQETNNNSFSVDSGIDWEFDINEIQKANSELLSGCDYYSYPSARIRVSDRVDFDNGMLKIYSDLGFDEGSYFSDFGSDSASLHSDLTAFEFRGADAINTLLPFIILILFLTLIVWALQRFVIDNAFEISIQERSTQFASLRIMGASKAQLATLVLTEGLFYAVTALPIGILLAFAVCKAFFSSMKDVGFSSFRFEANPVITIVGILLSLSAIIISSYTSAMWASRKLSPSELLNYGKPSKKTKKHSKRRSEIKNGKKGFMVRYTLKNIFRTKKRFLIATIAMSLGVLLFNFCVMMGASVFLELNSEKHNIGKLYDYTVYSAELDNIEEAHETLSDKNLFSEYRLNCLLSVKIETDAENEWFHKLSLYHNEGYVHFMSINRQEYNEKLEMLTKISYDEFSKSDKFLVYLYPEDAVRGEYFANPDESGFGENPVITLENGEKLEIMGSVGLNQFEGGNQCVIFPEEKVEDIMKKTDTPFLNVNIRASAKGHKNHEESEECFKEAFNISGMGDWDNAYFFNTGRKEFIKTIVNAIIAFVGTIWLAGIFSMINTINTSVLNRRPELKMMRAVGMSEKQLASTIILESVLFSAFSAVIGTLLGAVSFNIMAKYAFGGMNLKMSGIAIIIGILSLLINVAIAALAAVPAIKSIKNQPAG